MESLEPRFVPQYQPMVTDADVASVETYLRSGGWVTEFKETEEFERELAYLAGVKHASAVTSGTVALYLTLLALGISPGDKVIVPDFTFIATANAVEWCGAEAVLTDVRRDNLCLDLDSLPELDRSYKALIYVSMNGRSGDMASVAEFCDAHGLYLVEDSCQALGSKSSGRALGSFGIAGAFSFTPQKLITTGQGGALVTDDSALHGKVEKLKDFMRVRSGVDIHEGLGFNFKYTDLQAVLGRSQLRSIDHRIARKRGIYDTFRSELTAIPQVELIETNLEETVPLCVDVLVPGSLRDPLMQYLGEHGIGTRPFYPPLHEGGPYIAQGDNFPVAKDVTSRGFWLPSSILLEDSEIERVCSLMRQFDWDS